MATSRIEEEGAFAFQDDMFAEQQYRLFWGLHRRLQKILRRYCTFHCLFFLLFLGEVTALAISYAFLLQAALFALGLSALFITVFSYLLLKVYFGSKKWELFEEALQDYIQGIKKIIRFRKGIGDHHYALAVSLSRLASLLFGREKSIVCLPFGRGRSEKFQNLSRKLFHRDYLQVRELAMRAAIEELVCLIRDEPTNLELHACLANYYVGLAGLFVEYIQGEELSRQEKVRMLPQDLKDKYHEAARSAVEELKILEDFAPHDPWVHTQLALSFHDLQMPEEELKEYEIIQKLKPDDTDTLMNLGRLYFELGQIAAGLKMYQQLKKMNYAKAKELIEHYGSLAKNELLFHE